MSKRHVVVPAILTLLLSGGLAPADGADATLPEMVVVHDTRTSDPVVDISEVRIFASWYWDSEQAVLVKVPNGFRPGHRLTVYFDLNGDSTPDGHYDLQLRAPKRPGGSQFQVVEQFRLGGGWKLAGGTKVRCSDSEGYSPSAGDRDVGERRLGIALDLWDCLQVPKPVGTDSGSWRVAVRVAKGRHADMAPNGRKWSKPVAGWGPCDPAGGACP